MRALAIASAVPRPALAALIALCGSLLLLTLWNLFSGVPEAKAPAESVFYNPSLERWGGATEPKIGAFSDRPLFSQSRRPDPPYVAPPTEAPVPTEEAVATLDGWVLLGIFNSGEVKGAIVRQGNGGRERLVVGEEVAGWRLESVGPRAVMFTSISDGAQARLSMALADVAETAYESPRSEQGEIRPAVPPEAGQAASTSEAPASEEGPPPMSFEAMYRDRRPKND